MQYFRDVNRMDIWRVRATGAEYWNSVFGWATTHYDHVRYIDEHSPISSLYVKLVTRGENLA